MNCKGCLAIKDPFWGTCDVKICCEERKHDHCGQCSDFPCDVLTEMAYAEQEGDDGKRIETCRMWAAAENNTFDAAKFVSAVAGQDADTLQSFFTPDAVICWHDSNEQFTAAEYIRANCEYPGSWGGEVAHTAKTESGMIIVSKIFSKSLAVFVTSVLQLTDGKISRADEYYADYNEEIPNWRKKMNIGKPIN